MIQKRSSRRKIDSSHETTSFDYLFSRPTVSVSLVGDSEQDNRRPLDTAKSSGQAAEHSVNQEASNRERERERQIFAHKGTC